MEYDKLLFVLLASVLVLIISKGPAWLQARKACGQRLSALAGVLPDGARLDGRYLLYFWSPSCGMCRNTTTIINALMESRQDVISLNVLEHMELAQEVGIMGTPAFMLVDQQKVERLVLGSRSRKQLLEMLTP